MRIDYVSELQKLKDTPTGLLFLYPFLELPKNIEPLGIYMGFRNVETDNLLVLLFHKKQNNYSDQMIKEMKNNNLFLCSYEEDEYVYMIFEFLKYHSFYEKIKNGEYSTIRFDYKAIILQSNNKLAKIALYPDEHYELIAEDLEIDIEYLIEGRELLPPPSDKDYIHTSKKLTKQLHNDFIGAI